MYITKSYMYTLQNVQVFLLKKLINCLVNVQVFYQMRKNFVILLINSLHNYNTDIHTIIQKAYIA